jgi:PAS domain S-box-containing protein
MISKSGKTIYVQTGGTLIPKTKEIIGVARNITDQKRAERALRHSEKRYRSVIENIQDVFYRSDDQGRLMMGSPSGAKMFGYDSMDDMIGLPLEHFWPNPQERQALLEGVKRDGSVKDFEAVLKRKDGSTFNAAFTTHFYYGEDGRVQGTEGIIRDLTNQKVAEKERQSLESQLVQAQKMEAVGTLAGGIAHDFNNSLQGILGYTQILLLNLQEDKEAVSVLNKIKTVTRRAGELTEQLLAYSRKVESKLRPVDLNQEVRQIENLLSRTIPKMIDIELHLSKDINIIKADATQLEQVITNIGINARDAMPEGGKLTIETENVVLDEWYCKRHVGAVPGNYVMLSISDNGVGMDKEILEHIFEPFYTTKEMDRGTGLGLAMVYGIVKSHGGYIMCYSEPGEGTIFRIYFPALEMEPEPVRYRPEPVQKELVGGNETILVVDDEDAIREFAEKLLNKFGYTVITADNGEKALEIYQEKKASVSLVILDLIMPGMGGEKCLEAILQIDPSQRVIIASGYSVNGLVRETLERGAKGYIKKPYELEPFLNEVRNVLDQE